MHVIHKTLQAPKQGERLEDAFYCPAEGSELPSAGPIRFAVADGASSFAFSDYWAYLVACAFGEGRLDPCSPDFPQQLSECSKVWKKRVEVLISGLSVFDQAFLRRKVKDGAATTLAGIEIHQDNADGEQNVLSFHATTIGDSCIFIHRGNCVDGTQDVALPPSLQAPMAPPNLICTSEQVMPAAEAALTATKSSGTLCRGDSVLLLSDALARWHFGDGFCLANTRMERLPILHRFIEEKSDERRLEDFCRWVDEKREARELELDDVTMIWIDVQ